MLTTLCLCLAVTSDLPPMVPGMPVPKPKLESPKAAGEQYTSMVRPVRVVLVVPQGFMVTNISVTSGTTTLGWQLGTPPFQVYGCPTLNGSWNTVGNSTLAWSKAFPAGLNHFWRVRDQAKSVLTLNSNSQPRLTWTAPDTDMSDSLGNFTVQKSTDQVNWSNITENGGAYPPTARQANDATVPSPTIYYRLLQTTAHGVTVPYNMASLGSQAPGDVALAKNIGGIYYDTFRDLKVDSAGNIYVLGVFNSTIDFTLDGTGVDGSTKLTPADTSSGAAFLAKYTSSMSLVWVKKFEFAPYLYATERSTFAIARESSDPAANIYITGLWDTGMLKKLNSLGMEQWTKGPTIAVPSECQFNCADVDSAGNVVVFGTFKVSLFYFPLGVDFGDGHTLHSYGSYGTFLARYNSSGTCLSAVHFYDGGSGGTERASALVVDRNHADAIHVLVLLEGGIDFGGGALVQQTFGFFGAVAKLQSDGTYNAGAGSWQRICSQKYSGDPSVAYSKPQSLAVDANGDVIVGIVWSVASDFGGGKRTAQLNGNNSQLAVAKYAGSDGHWIRDWEILSSFSSGCGAHSIAPVGQLGYYVTGSFAHSTDFGGIVLDSAKAQGEPGGPTFDIFVAFYNASGVIQWAKRFGGTSVDSGLASVFDPVTNKLLVGGTYNDNLDGTATSFGSTALPAVGQQDIFVLKLFP